MIRRKACNLRTAEWRQVDSNQLMERIRQEEREGEATWTVTQWVKRYGYRSYLLSSSEGSLYALFFERR